MRIGIQTWGSEGDVRPFIALGAGLKAAGHEVRLGVSSEDRDYDALSKQFGFELFPVGQNQFPTLEEMDWVLQEITRQRIPITQMKRLMELAFDPVVPEMTEAARDLCGWADAVVGHLLHYPLAIMAEGAGIPNATVTLAHLTMPTRYRHPHGAPKLGEWGNRFGWWAMRKFVNWMMLGDANRLCVAEGVAPKKELVDELWISKRLNLIGVSPSICAQQPDWGPETAVCGFLSLPDKATEWEMPDKLSAFLDGGDPPVYFTLGSLSPRQPSEQRALVDIFVEAASLADCRAIIQAGDPAIFPQRETVHYLAAAPHARVFPHCSAVVNHGSSGTSQTALGAGVPIVPIPHISEQEFWGEELKRLGVSPGWVHRRKLTAKRLAKLLRAVRGDSFRVNAKALGESISKEDGVATAVKLIEEKLLG